MAVRAAHSELRVYRWGRDCSSTQDEKSPGKVHCCQTNPTDYLEEEQSAFAILAKRGKDTFGCHQDLARWGAIQKGTWQRSHSRCFESTFKTEAQQLCTPRRWEQENCVEICKMDGEKTWVETELQRKGKNSFCVIGWGRRSNPVLSSRVWDTCGKWVSGVVLESSSVALLHLSPHFALSNLCIPRASFRLQAVKQKMKNPLKLPMTWLLMSSFYEFASNHPSIHLFIHSLNIIEHIPCSQ